jgi:hypothetical protein
MKKLLLALLLLAIVVAVGYFQAKRHSSEITSAYDSGHSQAGEEVAFEKERGDSLGRLAESYRSEMAESLAVRDSLQAHERDSLTMVVATKDDSLSRLEKVAEAGQASQEKKASRKSYSREEILSFYKSGYRDLPKDLSPYERRVALTELRDKTARKFSITLAELTKIRNANNLDY